MSKKTIQVRKKYKCLFENESINELIYVHYEDLDGYVHFEHIDDPTMQIHKITPVELFNNYKIV